MSGSGRVAIWAAGLAVACVAWTAPAGAQLSDTDMWRVDITPYAWLSGLDGTVGVRSVASEVDLSPADVLDMLQFGIMGRVDGRRGPWVVSVDGMYASLGAGRALAIRGDTGSLELSERETMIQPTGGYTIGGDFWSLDLLAGLRYWNVRASLDVDRTRRPPNERSISQQWVDATGGFRFNFLVTDKVRFAAAADGGGGGARSTWQASSSLGYDVWSKWTLGFAYRVLAVDYDRNDFLSDTRTRGMVVGATYRTW